MSVQENAVLVKSLLQVQFQYQNNIENLWTYKKVNM